MTEKMFKLSVAAAMEMEEVIAMADAVPEQTSETAGTRGVELQRIDRSKDTTVVFFVSGKEGARAFREVFEKAGRKARVTKADPKELFSCDSIKG